MPKRPARLAKPAKIKPERPRDEWVVVASNDLHDAFSTTVFRHHDLATCQRIALDLANWEATHNADTTLDIPVITESDRPQDYYDRERRKGEYAQQVSPWAFTVEPLTAWRRVQLDNVADSLARLASERADLRLYRKPWRFAALAEAWRAEAVIEAKPIAPSPEKDDQGVVWMTAREIVDRWGITSAALRQRVKRSPNRWHCKQQGRAWLYREDEVRRSFPKETKTL